MKRDVFILLAAIGLLCATGCHKEETAPDVALERLVNKNAVDKGMLYFEDFEQLFKEMTMITQMDDAKRISYEKSIGYTSFATETERIYIPIAESEQNTPSMATALLEKYPNYFKLWQEEGDEEYNELTFEPILASNPYRYIINANQLFQVKDTLFKIFEEAIVYTHTENYKALLEITAKDLQKLGSEFTVISDKKKDGAKKMYNTVKEVVERETNGKDRTRVRVYFQTGSDNRSPDYSLYAITRPLYRVLGIWWWCQRRIDLDLTMTIKVNATTVTKRWTQSNSSAAYAAKFAFYDKYLYLVHLPEGISQIEGYAKTPNAKVNFSVQKQKAR